MILHLVFPIFVDFLNLLVIVYFIEGQCVSSDAMVSGVVKANGIRSM